MRAFQFRLLSIEPVPPLSYLFYSHGQSSKVPATVTFAKFKAKEPAAVAMSASEIQSWISSSINEGDEDRDPQVWQRDRVLNDWPRSLEYAQTFLLHGRTKSRIQFLQDEILSLAKHEGIYWLYLFGSSFFHLSFIDLSLSQILDVFKLLTLTYPRYSDSGSQDAVEAVGIELVRRDELRSTDAGDKNQVKLGVAEQILGWLSNEVGKLVKNGNSECVVHLSRSLRVSQPISSSYAPSDLFVLLSWSCGLYAVCIKHDPHFTSSNSWKGLITSMAILLDIIAESTKAKPALKKGALVRTRRALRSVWSNLASFNSSCLSSS